MIFGKEFEEKKEKINALCKELLDKDEKFIVKALYDVSNIVESQPGENLQERLSKTPYTDEPMDKFMTHFLKNEFCKMRPYDLEFLFQELHNRECARSNIEPRYIVSVKCDPNDRSNGYMVPGSNELNINGNMIERYQHWDTNNNYGKNANTIGAHSAFTLIHETQHTAQMEGIMNFALNNEKNMDERARDAIFFLDILISEYAEENADTELQYFIQNAYWFNYMEHHSNMAPVKFMAKALKNGYITDSVFLDALAYRTTNDIHIKEQPTEKRVLDMEKIIVKYNNILKNNVKDGPLKNEIVKVIEEYTKVDENGNSPLRTSLTKDFEMAKDMIKYCETFSTSKKDSANKNYEEDDENLICIE